MKSTKTVKFTILEKFPLYGITILMRNTYLVKSLMSDNPLTAEAVVKIFNVYSATSKSWVYMFECK